MGDPIVVWPPDSGNYAGPGCDQLFGYGYSECGSDYDGSYSCCQMG